MVDPPVLSEQYQKILASPIAMTELLVGTGFFKNVKRGFPENQNTHRGDLATVFFQGLDFSETHGSRNRPEFIESIIGIICKGTKTEVHDKITATSLYVTSRFEDDQQWVTLKGNVRNTFITDFNIYPEKQGNTLLTTAVINLKHDVRWRR